MAKEKFRKVFLFDVESDGLHGEGFAFGFVRGYLTPDGVAIVKKGGGIAGIEEVKDPWVRENVLPNLREAIEKGELQQLPSRKALRDAFWRELQEAKREGYEIWSDCNWPVEANFLSACVADDPQARAWEGPYPLKDLATLLDVNVSREEVSGVRYDHNPLNDALASLIALGKVVRGEA